MLLKTIIFLYLFGNFNAAISKGIDLEPSSTNVKEITVSIEHNSDNRNENSSDESKKNSPTQRTRANLLLNSKVIYPPGSKTASAFNQGILKFQQLLELPLNDTASNELMEPKNNNLEEAFNKSAENSSETRNITIINEQRTENKEVEGHEARSEETKTLNCGNSSIHGDPEASLRILKNDFIDDFGTSKESISNIIDDDEVKNGNNLNRTEKVEALLRNKTQHVELIQPVNLRSNNSSSKTTEDKKSSIEILDDDFEDNANGTDTKSNTAAANQTLYLPAERKSSEEIIEVKPQKLQEIPLNLNHKNSARKEDRQDVSDGISQNIKRDILLGNLNPFFTNPSTNSIRNTNSIFFDDMLKKSKGLIGPMNPFVINSISFDGSRSTTSRTPSFARLKVAAPKSSGAVKTLKSISLGDDSPSSSFGSKLGGHSSSLSGLSSSLGGSSSSFGGLSSSLGGSSPSFGGLSSTLGGHSSSLKYSSKTGSHASTVRGRRPGFSRFRNKPSKSKATTVETVPSVHLGDGKKSTQLDFGASPSFSSSFNSKKSSVKTIPSLLIKEEDESPKFSSTYQNRAPAAVSSASFTFTPSGSRSHGRSSSFSRHSKPKTHSKPAVSFSNYSPPRKSSGHEGAEGVEILKSVDYSLPEEVGKSLEKTGPSKFKRKAAFEPPKIPVFSMQASVTVDPLMVNFDMYRKSQDNSFNPYLVNTQMKQFKRNTEKARSFEFRPSLPDSRTRQVKEFNPELRKKSYFQPSLQFQTITESPHDNIEMIEAYAPEDEGVDDIQNIENFESDMLFKPFFATQSPKSFHMNKNKPNERSPRSFHNLDINFATQSPRSFQMPESSPFRYFGNVHMIDLS